MVCSRATAGDMVCRPYNNPKISVGATYQVARPVDMSRRGSKGISPKHPAGTIYQARQVRTAHRR